MSELIFQLSAGNFHIFLRKIAGEIYILYRFS